MSTTQTWLEKLRNVSWMPRLFVLKPPPPSVFDHYESLIPLALFLPFHPISRLWDTCCTSTQQTILTTVGERVHTARTWQWWPMEGKSIGPFNPLWESSWRKKKAPQMDDRFIVYRLSINSRDFFWEKGRTGRPRYVHDYVRERCFLIYIRWYMYSLEFYITIFSLSDARDYINSSSRLWEKQIYVCVYIYIFVFRLW